MTECLFLIDVGVPMIFPALPVMLVALLPIIVIEALVLRQYLTIPLSKAGEASGLANLASTFIGVPMTWVTLVAAQLLTGGGRAFGLKTLADKFLAVTWQTPWLIPYERNLYWMIPTAALVLLVPFFFVSWYLEYLVAGRILKDFDAKKTKRAVAYANLTSYALLALYLVIVLATSNPPNTEPIPV
ncbi:MAG TPA: hypothetical protein VLM38_03055 [Blastocatellia bacterium]|nr:hypothetical protein [Blastocatellia bacterium]